MTSHSKNREGVLNHGEGYGVLVDGYVMERRYRVEQKEYVPLSQGIEDFVDAGGGNLSKGADRVKLLVIGRSSDVTVMFRDRYHWAGVRGSRRLDYISSQV